jgi:hypothetical protein
MIPLNKALDLLRSMLVEEEVDLELLDLVKTWQVFKRFLAIPVETESHVVFVDWLAVRSRDFPGEQDFLFAMVRQLQYPGEEEYEQIKCSFYYRANPKIISLKGIIWLNADLQAFITEVETNPAYHILPEYSPYKTYISQDMT